MASQGISNSDTDHLHHLLLQLRLLSSVLVLEVSQEEQIWGWASQGEELCIDFNKGSDKIKWSSVATFCISSFHTAVSNISKP